MVARCCVVGCSSASCDWTGKKIPNGLSFYRFPTWRRLNGKQMSSITKSRRLAWVAAVRRPNITFNSIPVSMRVCSRHFHSDPVKMIFKAEDPDVLLSCSFRGDLRDKKVIWNKDGKDIYVFGNNKVEPSLVDEQFRGRISHFQDGLQSGNASIKITNATISDVGIYSCLFYDGVFQRGLWQIELTVGYVRIGEGKDAVLPCHHGINLTAERFDWKKDGKDIFLYDNRKVTYSPDGLPEDRLSHFPDELQSGNASIKIEKAKRSDSGNYTCIRINQSGDKVSELHIELVVGTCPKPSFSVLGTKDAGSQVECKAVGAFPIPEMELRNDANVTLKPEVYNVTQNGESFDIILQAVVTEKGYYRCVLTQQDIYHQISSKKSWVTMPSDNCPQPSFSVLGTRDAGRQVECKAVGAFSQPKMELRNDADVTLKPEVYNVTPNGNYSEIILRAVVTEEGYYHCVLTQERICHQISSKRSEVLMPSDSILHYAGIMFFVLIFILLIGIVIFIIHKCCRRQHPDGRRKINISSLRELLNRHTDMSQ